MSGHRGLCSQCLSPLTLWVRISTKLRCTTLCDKVCQWLSTVRWFSLGPPVSSTNKTDCYDITEIELKVALSAIKQTKTDSLWFLTKERWNRADGNIGYVIWIKFVTEGSTYGPKILAHLNMDAKVHFYLDMM